MTASQAWDVLTEASVPAVYALAASGEAISYRNSETVKAAFAQLTSETTTHGTATISHTWQQYVRHHGQKGTQGAWDKLPDNWRSNVVREIVTALKRRNGTTVATNATLIYGTTEGHTTEGHSQHFWNEHPNKAKAAGVAVTTAAPSHPAASNPNTGASTIYDKALVALASIAQQNLAAADQSSANRNLTDVKAINAANQQGPDYTLWAVGAGLAYLVWRFVK